MKPVRFQRAETLPLLTRRLEEALKPVSDCPLLVGRLLTGVSLATAADTSIDHGLGRVPEGWIVTDTDAENMPKRTAWDDKTITLYSTPGQTVSLWVF